VLGDGVAEGALGLTSFGALGLIATLGDVAIGLVMNSLEAKGFSRTLAEPNLVALSGNQARFLAGQDVPIPTVDADGQTDVEFKEVGVALNFTPTVLDDDLINLELSVEVSSIDTTTPGIPISATQGNVIPLFNVRRATTAIELRDGQSFAIAGLLEDNFTDAVSQFPWLGDIPVLGALFRSTNYARGETELVIIVTVHLVVPVSEEELSVPSDHVRIPNEFELFLLGNVDGAGAPGMVQSQGFDGDFGYVVE
jgi:pilus assembly protein CpaC